MKRSTERILTTHTGSLPRPDDLVTLVYTKERGEQLDQAVFADRVREVTATVVRQQLECGLDVINDGEVSKVGYSTYVKDRLSGFDGEVTPLPIADLEDFTEYAKRVFANTPIEEMKRRPARGRWPIGTRPRSGPTWTISKPRSTACSRQTRFERGLTWRDFFVSQKRLLPRPRGVSDRLGWGDEGGIRRDSPGRIFTPD